VKGRKRHILVDTNGLLLQVLVHAAHIQDQEGGKLLLAPLQGRFPRLKLIWVDSAYKQGDFVEWENRAVWLLGRGGGASLEWPAWRLGP
jgi:putative transposase